MAEPEAQTAAALSNQANSLISPAFPTPGCPILMLDSAILVTERSISMAKGVNKVMLLGNVGKDPEIRTSGSGMTIATFSLATADRAKDAQGNWVDKPEWHNLVCFDKLAETAKNYIKKGSSLFVEGKITSRSWDDKETGQKKYRTEIIVNDFTFVGSKTEGGGSTGGYSSARSSSSSSTASAPSNDYADQGITDEDIPF
jgi:single-strand DNA-binding protein